MNILNFLLTDRERTLKILNKATRILPKDASGKLRTSTSYKSNQYYWRKDGEKKYKYLNKDQLSIAKKIITRDYCLDLINYSKNKLRYLDMLIDDYQYNGLDSLYDNLSDARKALIGPVAKTLSQRQEIFEAIQYEGRPFNPDDMSEYYTSKGERVRSKSEILIADELARYGIAYHYEMPETYSFGNRKVVIYSDFHAMNKRTGKIYIIEHFGLLDDDGYTQDTLWKLDVYERNDILLGRDLIAFHETKTMPLSVKTVDKYIEEYLL